MMSNNKRGFTLIELLVVVLIIAILAAVALPQYQKAVDKARVAEMIQLVRAVADAKVVHYLETGTYARKFEDLSLELPAKFSIRDDDYYGQKAAWDGKFTIWLDAGSREVAGQIMLSDKSSLVFYAPVKKGRMMCFGTFDSRADQLCKSLPHATYYGSNDTKNLYYVF